MPGHATAEQLFGRWPRLTNSVVALAGSADTPPAGKLGYWSDGAEHVALVTLSASGRRLFIEYEGDVLHTNVAGYLFGIAADHTRGHRLRQPVSNGDEQGDPGQHAQMAVRFGHAKWHASWFS